MAIKRGKGGVGSVAESMAKISESGIMKRRHLNESSGIESGNIESAENQQ